MLKRNPPSHIVGLSAFLSLLLFGVCAVTAGYLYWQLRITERNLAEDVGSRKAAQDLETTLMNLVSLLEHGSDQVEALHERIDSLLGEVSRLADKQEEIRLAAQLRRGYARYQRLWENRADARQPAEKPWRDQALIVVQDQMLPECRALRDFNAAQSEKSEAEHRESIRQMVWGLVAVGSLGSLLGLVLGYGAARGLRQSLCRMSVSVRDAAGKLGAELPAVSLTTDGDLHHMQEQMQGVVREIEQVVDKLQAREREVLRAEQMNAVGQLAAGAAHELRNPLTSIKMLVQAGLERTEKRDLPAGHLALIEREIRRMERCLQGFLDFARPPRPECRLLDPATIVEQSFALLAGRARQQGVELHFHQPPEPLRVEADAGQLHQLLVNLALNALDVMPEGGTLDVHLGATDGQVELRVEDSGPGIAPELLPRLFQPFVSTKETGLGLGLVVAQRIAESHQGTLAAANRPAGGACFTLRLPRVSPPALPLEEKPLRLPALATATERSGG
jgi:two-component system sensor histidine kinase HydH